MYSEHDFFLFGFSSALLCRRRPGLFASAVYLYSGSSSSDARGRLSAEAEAVSSERLSSSMSSSKIADLATESIHFKVAPDAPQPG